MYNSGSHVVSVVNVSDADVRAGWKPCQDAGSHEMYYFNFKTEASRYVQWWLQILGVHTW